MSQSLAGRRILVTRAPHQAGKLSQALRALGAEPVEVPVLEIRPPASFEPLDECLRQLGRYQWLILTSVNSVTALADRAEVLGVGLSDFRTLKVAAVGSATADAARHAGLAVTVVPESYVAEGLLESLPANLSGQRFLLARAAVARDVIPEALRSFGAIIDVVEAYQNGMPADAPEKLLRALAIGIDAAAFTSSSSVTHLAQAAAKAEMPFPLPGVKAVSIGPVTTGTLLTSNWRPAAEASTSDIPGLVAAVVAALT